MFDKSYTYHYHGYKKDVHGEAWLKEHKFSFDCRLNQRYIVNVEEYPYDMYVPKFHLKAHTDSDQKYQLLTGFNDASRVISTCIRVMLSFHKENPAASFGFVGINLVNESKETTKRFRVYRQLMINLFSPIKFSHFEYEQESAYIILNKQRQSEEENLLEKIEALFREHYLFR